MGGNIFRDLEREDADIRHFKAILPSEIIKRLDREELTVRAAQELTGIDASDFFRIRNASLDRFTVDRLMATLHRLGFDVCRREEGDAIVVGADSRVTFVIDYNRNQRGPDTCKIHKSANGR